MAYAVEQGISVADVNDHQVLRRALDPAVRAVLDDPGNFAEPYMTDDGGRWNLVISYVEGPEAAAAQSRIEALLWVDAPVEWRQVIYSQTYLLGVKGDIDSLLTTYSNIHTVGIDTKSNRVHVGVRVADPDLSAAFTADYGDAVQVVVEPAGEPI